MSKSLNQRQIDTLLQQGQELEKNGALAEAEERFREILAARPKHLDTLKSLARLTTRAGRIDESIALWTQAISINGMQADSHSNLAAALNATRQFENALASANRALALKPNSVVALNNRGNALSALNRQAEALASFDRALALQPDAPEPWINRCNTLRELDRAEDAVASADRAIELRPNSADAWCNRGGALTDLGRYPEAEQSYQQALAIRPNFVDAWSNLGLALVNMRRHDDALSSYDRALALAPGHAITHENRGNCLLAKGELDEGWREYEWRWQSSGASSKRPFTEPQWFGVEPLDGKTILLHAEQGLGDTLHFCRYVPLVAQRGAKVVLEVQPSLIRLLAPLEGVAQLVAQGEPLPVFDYHCPLMSLPFAFKTNLSNIPGKTPYLSADPEAIERWGSRIASAMDGTMPGVPKAGVPKLKVGLVWGSALRDTLMGRQSESRRSIGLQRLMPLLDVPGIQFFSVQKGPHVHQLAALCEHHDAPRRIVDLTDELTDFADTAAFVSNLDLVISVCTSTAHLAGAIGKPVWILARFHACWRWMLERSDSPWYTSARLFRQPAFGDWDSVIAEVREALAAHAAAQ